MPLTSSSRDHPLRRRGARRAAPLVPYVALVVALLAELPLLSPQPFGRTDALLNWYAGHLLARGGSPHDQAQWVEAVERYGSPVIQSILGLGVAVWPYPPWTGYLLLPFGALPVEVGPWAEVFSYALVGVVSSVAYARLLTWRSRAGYALGLVLLATFQPFVHSVNFGQFGSFLFAGATFVAIGLARRSGLALAAGTAILFAKPQLSLGLALVVIALLVRSRAWRPLVASTVTLAAIAVVAIALHPESLAVAREALSQRLEYTRASSSTWSLAGALAGDAWLVAGAGVGVLATLACVAAVAWSPPALRLWSALAAGLVASLVWTPIAHSYDQVLLMPAALVIAVASEGARPLLRATHRLIAVAGVLLLPWALFIAANSWGTPAPSAAVPLVFAVLLAGSARLARS